MVNLWNESLSFADEGSRRCFCGESANRAGEPAGCRWDINYGKYLQEDDISGIGPLIPNGAAGLHFICLAADQASPQSYFR